MAIISGLQIKVDGTSIVKLTNGFKYYRYFDKVSETVSTPTWIQVRDTFYSKSFTVSSLTSGYKTILAVRAASGKCWLTKTSETSTSVTFKVIAELGHTMSAYVFTTAPPPRNPSKSGIEVKDPSTGLMVFCSDYPVLKVLGSYNSDNGYVGLSTTGKTCAVVPMKEWINEGSVDDLPPSPNCEFAGQEGWTGQLETYEYRSVVDTNTNPPSHSLRSYWQSIFIPCQSSPTIATGTTVSTSSAFLVIDATGL